MVNIGFGGSINIPYGQSSIYIGKEGQIKFMGQTWISSGVNIRIEKGTVTIGADFFCNRNMNLMCTTNVTIGNSCIMGWNTNISTTNGHTIIIEGIESVKEERVSIGNNVWIASNVDVAKGASIPDGTIVAQRSVVNKKFSIVNCLIGGIPARILKQEIQWKV